jgi:tRNA (cmo5U34)-methyltransferase
MMVAPKDELFREKHGAISDFEFGVETARVFDDMLVRSVPLYAETQRMIAELTADFAQPGTRVYDLGCSTGTTFLGIDPHLAPDIGFVGVDSSSEMLKKAEEKFAQARVSRAYELRLCDLEDVTIEDASVVIMNLTLQFVRPIHRKRVIDRIASGLCDGGALILVEKVLSPNSRLNRLFIDHYYDFKRRNGYSDLEISQKREALENVLIPYHPEENRQLLLSSGFSSCDEFMRWFNFCGVVALK